MQLTATKTKTVVGLEIEADSIAATEVRVNGHAEVAGYGIEPLATGVFREGEVADVEALAASLKELFSREKLSRTVRLGIANQRVAVRSVRMPAIDSADELETAVRFQAADHIPMPLEQAVLDWEVVGHSTGPNDERQIDVVMVAARRDMLAPLLDAIEAAGLRPVGIDLSAFGMIRALGPQLDEGPVMPQMSYEERLALGAAMGEDASLLANPDAPASIVCNLGDVTNLAVVQGRNCAFTRITSFGIEGIVQKVAERRGLTLEHARQWLVHVGLDAPLEAVEGDPEIVSVTRDALADGAAKIADEIRLSLDYYATQDNAVAVERVIACGFGTTIPGMTDRLQRALGLGLETGRPSVLGHLDPLVAARLTLSYGLALEL